MNTNLYISRKNPVRRLVRLARIACNRLLPQRHSFTPNVHVCTIHIWYGCNMRCWGCFNLVHQAPTKETMTPAQLKEFLDESARTKYLWKALHFSGGESTLHPQFAEMCQLMAAYKAKHNPDVVLGLATNGVGVQVRAGIRNAELYGFEVGNSKKIDVENAPADHRPFMQSPMDLGEKFNEGCLQSEKCGIVFTTRGFYPCDPMAAADRVFHFGPTVTELSQLTVDRMKAGFSNHCHNCGLARRRLEYNPRALMTKTWETVIAKYATET